MSKARELKPQLRFPRFAKNGMWEKKSLGDITNVVSNRNKENKILPVYSINNKEGFLPQNEQFEGADSSDRGYDISLYKIIESNTFAYNPARIDVGSIGYSRDLHNIIISSLYVCFQTTQEVDDKFLWQFFGTLQFNHSVKRNVEGGIRNYLFYENFSKIKIALPRLKEQKKIASCLSSLDDLITAHSDRLEALKVHKKGLMQKLFPQEGEKVPKFRFPKFEDRAAWQEKELGKVANFFKGKGISKSDITGNGSLPCIRYGELYTQYNETIRKVHSYTNLNANNLVLSEINDVIIPASGESHNDIATASCVLLEGVALGGDLNIIRTNIDGVFLSYYLNNAKRKEISQLAQGVSVVHLYPSQLKSLIVCIPKPDEQKKIASCLSTLSELIAMQDKKIGQLLLHKNGLMQGLFPKIDN